MLGRTLSAMHDGDSESNEASLLTAPDNERNISAVRGCTRTTKNFLSRVSSLAVIVSSYHAIAAEVTHFRAFRVRNGHTEASVANDRRFHGSRGDRSWLAVSSSERKSDRRLTLDPADHLGNSRYEPDTDATGVHPHTGRYRFPRVA